MEDLHLKAGLVKSGKNDEGEPEYIGTQEQWDKYEELEKTVEECLECGYPIKEGMGHGNSCVKGE